MHPNNHGIDMRPANYLPESTLDGKEITVEFNPKAGGKSSERHAPVYPKAYYTPDDIATFGKTIIWVAIAALAASVIAVTFIIYIVLSRMQ